MQSTIVGQDETFLEVADELRLVHSSSDLHMELAERDAAVLELQRELADCKMGEAALADANNGAATLGKQLRHRAQERLALLQEVHSMRGEARAMVAAEESAFAQSVASYRHLASEVLEFHGEMEGRRRYWVEREAEEVKVAAAARAEEQELRRQLDAAEAKQACIVEAYNNEMAAMATSSAKARAAAAEISIASAQVVLSSEERQSEHERQSERLAELARSYEEELAGASLARQQAERRAGAGKVFFPDSEQAEAIQSQCRAGEHRLETLERWFSEQVEQNAVAVQFAASEFRRAEAVWADRLRREEERRQLSDERAAEAQLALVEAQAALQERQRGGAA